ncbi:MAG: tRNA (5-methylaminomethyl-2-thiouridine)(34)-methyltransferase MnmD [Bacteroidales bacterium]|nr:tRNA (5-methylaminomethyl-2-thiouridine)(34)-methyltransferase MnmD [Bacteroidales bacterium]
MKREIVITADGSSTIRLCEEDECYHSVNGALAESLHIFINNGLKRFLAERELINGSKPECINILEVGLGTGLNCVLTAIESLKYNNLHFNYITLEKYPVTADELKSLNYENFLGRDYNLALEKIHSTPWGIEEDILPNFTLTKIMCDIKELEGDSLKERISNIDVVFFDAFSPNIQPELWSREIFEGLFSMMSGGAILITYSSRGSVKSSLREAGFTVKRLKGPSGKRHITLATRPDTFLASFYL